MNTEEQNAEAVPEWLLDKFTSAVRSLAIGAGDARSRLAVASYSIWRVDSDHLPEVLRKDFDWVKGMLTREEPVAKEGRLKASLRKLTNQEGASMVVQIYNIWMELHRRFIEDLKHRKE